VAVDGVTLLGTAVNVAPTVAVPVPPSAIELWFNTEDVDAELTDDDE
jgi:hypothetical protein